MCIVAGTCDVICVLSDFLSKAEFYIAEQSNISKPGKVEKPVSSMDNLFPSSDCKLLEKGIKEDKRSVIFFLGGMCLC